ncbi:cytosolic Cu/Zn superoxide dismutase [Pochonia chlamydosporia 170]|uniref:superoxide dismutase n=1 Tax=Pochonia chlamydosporia 170 TaxID=1380566 RepID=A0A179G3S0_METCM|nr:cytosolic Cu/Zn superoxide dismutase [Pochonia chlamydosporia 170]OAQ72515.1 cytosolic Cu/Zn superoxide dismutase [Pochonia chlamydosporia 170]
MRMKAIVVALGVTVNHATADDPAAVISGNPINVVYTATLPETPFFAAPELKGSVRGFISAATPPDGVGVRFTIRFENLPKTGGPFPYHIHVNQVADGNCSAAGGHLDPMNRGEDPPCDAGNLPSCQTGDLSGKYGTINSDPFVAEYVDKFSSLKREDGAFIGNRSFVIHLANKTRLTCGDFLKNQPVLKPVTLTPPGGQADSQSTKPCSKASSTSAAGNCPCNTQVTSTTATTTTTSTKSSTSSTSTTSTSSSSTSTITTTSTTATPTNTGVFVPTTTVVVAGAAATMPGSLLWWMSGAALMMFSH